MIDFQTKQYFDFLKQYGFKGPYEYNDGREMQTDFVNKDIIIKLSYDGRYWAFVIKTKRIIPELENGSKKLKDYDSNFYMIYDLQYLDPKKKLFNSVEFNNNAEKQLWYYSNLIRNNLEILNGNFSKFNLFHYFLRKLRIIK